MTDYILLLNNDTVVHGDSFSPLIEFLKSHERVGIVQGTMNIPALGNGLDDCGILLTPIGIQRHLHIGEPTASTKLSARKVFAAKGAMMMFKRCGATSCRFDSKFVWRRYFRNILYSFWRNFGFFGRFFTLPCFAFAAFVRSPSALCGALSDLIRGRTQTLPCSRS